MDMTWGRTGVRVGRANTRCILAGREELKTRNVVNIVMSSKRTKLDSTATFCDKYLIDHIRILSIGLELACNGG